MEIRRPELKNVTSFDHPWIPRNFRSAHFYTHNRLPKKDDKHLHLNIKKKSFCQIQKVLRSNFFAFIRIMSYFSMILSIFLAVTFSSTPPRCAMASEFPTTLKEFGYAFNGELMHEKSR